MHTTRRQLLAWGALSALGWTNEGRSALAQVAVGVGREGARHDTLISIFLRGGADSLSVVVPHGDDDYYRSRPTLALPHPRDGRTKAGERVIDLDGFFGLHPALGALRPLYEAGQLAVVHACGSGDQTRSHFEAMATMERGIAQESGPQGGWLARHLESAPWENPSPLRAIALGAMLPLSLRGTTHATALCTAADLQLHSPFAHGSESFAETLSALYSHDALGQAGQEALSVLKALRGISLAATSSAAPYPGDELGAGLRQVALLMKSGVGLEAACLDQTGYDTHVAQGNSAGFLADRLHSLGSSLAAFASDLGPERWGRTTVIVMSEFGRRVAENDGGGTDHGRAGAMLLLGGGVVGGKVHGVWPGLAPGALDGPGDLRVTTDYRAVLAEVVQKRLGNPHLGAIFPGLIVQPVGAVHA